MRPVVVLNKVDLCDEVDQRCHEVESIALGVAVLRLCAINRDSSDAIRHQKWGPGRQQYFSAPRAPESRL
ncbi:MAG: hypothetical protein R3C68_09855 [Myxococcota bacterium]